MSSIVLGLVAANRSELVIGGCQTLDVVLLDDGSGCKHLAHSICRSMSRCGKTGKTNCGNFPGPGKLPQLFREVTTVLALLGNKQRSRYHSGCLLQSNDSIALEQDVEVWKKVWANLVKHGNIVQKIEAPNSIIEGTFGRRIFLLLL